MVVSNSVVINFVKIYHLIGLLKRSGRIQAQVLSQIEVSFPTEYNARIAKSVLNGVRSAIDSMRGFHGLRLMRRVGACVCLTPDADRSGRDTGDLQEICICWFPVPPDAFGVCNPVVIDAEWPEEDAGSGSLSRDQEVTADSMSILI